MKKFSDNSYQGRCHGHAFVKECLVENWQVFIINGLFLVPIVFISDFLFQFEVGAIKLTYVPDFSQISKRQRSLMLEKLHDDVILMS